MAVQKRRKSKSARDIRRARWMARTKQPNAAKCPNCGAARLPHRICKACGYYGGEKILEVAQAESE